MNRRETLFLIAPVILGISCAPPKLNPISFSSDQKGITVTIDPVVVAPKEIYIHTRAQTIAAPFGLLGAALASGSPARVMDVMAENKIDIKTMLITELNTQLSKSNSITLTNNDSSEARLKLKIKIYGFTNISKESKFKENVKPFIRIESQLIKKDNSVIWQNQILVAPDHPENTIDGPLDDFINNPNKLRDALQNLAKIIANKVNSDLTL